MIRSRLLLVAAAVTLCVAGSASPAFAAPGVPAPPEPASVAAQAVPELVAGVHRIGGADRYAVSAAISAATFDATTPAPVAYVVSGEGFADALSASALAGLKGGPVLLVRKDSVPDEVGAELSRLDPARIVVLGGAQTISTTVQTQLERYSSSITRIDGADRYAVSAAASADALPGIGGIPVTYVASGENYPDALSAAPAAAKLGGPVLLVQKNAVPTAIRTELDRLKPRLIVAVGGEKSISAATLSALTAIQPTTTRVDGTDRFAVSAALSGVFPSATDTVYIASGATFPDALSGAAAAAEAGAPVLLVNTSTIPTATSDELLRLHPRRIVVLGGPKTVSEAVATQLKSYLRP